MNKEFAPYQESLELKELGFDEPCFALWFTENKQLIQQIFNDTRPYNKDMFILAPTFSQAFRWFKEFREYDDWCIESWIQPYLSDEPRQHEAFYWRRGEKVSVGVFSTYDEAQLGLLRKLIEIVKTKQ